MRILLSVPVWIGIVCSVCPSLAFPFILTQLSTRKSSCKAIPSSMTLCHGVGYSEMRLPNLLGHDTMKEALQQAGSWVPLLTKQCHTDTKKFLCSLFAPVCLSELEEAVYPCRSLCEEVRDGCTPVMAAFGFPWPDMFNCSQFPLGNELCVPPAGTEDKPYAAKEGHTVRMVSPAIALAFIPFIITLIIRYRHYFLLFYRAVLVRKIQDHLTGIPREERAFQYVITHAIPGDPQHVLNTFDQYCYHCEHLGNIGPQKGKILDRLIYENAPLNVLELGTYCGYATIIIAQALPLGARLYTVDANPQKAAVAEKVIRLAGFDDDTVELLVGPSEEIIPQLKDKHGVQKLDFVFMDHGKRYYRRDLLLLEDVGLLQEGTIILADNVFFPGAPHFLQYVKSSGKYHCKMHRGSLEYFRYIRDGMAELTFTKLK